MKIDNLGRPYFTASDMTEFLYQDKADKIPYMSFEQCSEIEDYNKLAKKMYLPELNIHKELDTDQETYDKSLQQNWFVPKENLVDVEEWLLERCNTDEERLRVKEELNEFIKHDMVKLLEFLIYLVGFMREHKIVWGVGRGSSVASYVLYLIGVHKVNSIQYGLDWREFLR
jgi:DNA polymerase III alpha subunit